MPTHESDAPSSDVLQQQTLGAAGGAGAGLVLERGAMLGRFVLLERLGAGGMGVVYSAYDGRLDRRVALKLLRPDAWGPVTSEAGRERLLREAQAMARLSHANVVTVYEVGTFEGQLFVAMEYVEGQTLSAWLKETPRSPSEVVRVLLAAGRGLAAAHAKGLVHRDFKPDNVLVARDGQVRVSDFGLVREEGEEAAGLPSDEVPAAAPGASRLTQSGMVMGTPGFMAPEQYTGARVDARADQYAFCATLYLCLFGHLPVEGDSKEALREAVQAGRLREVPSDARLPPRLRQALRRGLSTAPEARFASMEALLAELEATPRTRRWPWAVAAAALLLAVGLGGRTLSASRAVCRGAEARLAGVWDGPVRTAVRQALVAASPAYGADTATRVEERLDAWSRDWVAMHTEACEATSVRHEQSPLLMDLRMACLERRRSGLAATTRLLSQGGDAKLAARAVELVQGLEGLGGCADTEALTAAWPPPQDAQVRQQVEAVQARAEDARALERAGRYQEAVEKAKEVLAAARTLAHPPLIAESLVLVGKVQAVTNALPEAERALAEGAMAAARVRADALLAEAWTELIFVHHQQARFAEALVMGRTAEAAVERAGSSPVLRANVHNHLGNVALQQARFEEAAAHFQRAVDLLGGEDGRSQSGGIQQAAAYSNLGSALEKLGRFEESRAAHQRALALCERVVGPVHPRMAQALGNLGTLALAQEHYVEALEAIEASLRIKEKVLKPDDISLAITLSNLGMAYYMVGRYPDSRRSLERARDIFQQRHGPEHPDVALTLHNLGDLTLAEGHPREALALHEQVRGLWERTLGADHPDVALVLESLGADQMALGELAQARRTFERSLALWTKADGPDTLESARARLSLGEVLLAQGQGREARVHVERAERALVAASGGPTLVGRARAALARALWSEPSTRARALQLATTALEDFQHAEAFEAKTRRDELARWLAARPPATASR